MLVQHQPGKRPLKFQRMHMTAWSWYRATIVTKWEGKDLDLLSMRLCRDFISCWPMANRMGSDRYGLNLSAVLYLQGNCDVEAHALKVKSTGIE
jgi:hypothetical protein